MFYMHQWSYKDQQIKQMLLEHADRSAIVRIAIAEFPSSQHALASVLAICAQGRVNSIHTTPLLSPEEGLQAMREATNVIKHPQAQTLP